jgi:hypothetical protein
MNKTLETIRGSWITRDREAAEANRDILRNSITQIPAGLREKFVSVLKWVDSIEASTDTLLNATTKHEEKQIGEILFLEKEFKTLIDAIRQTKDADSIPGLRTSARESIGRIQDHKLREEQTRLAARTDWS